MTSTPTFPPREKPDAFALAQHARLRHVRGRNLAIAVGLALVVINLAALWWAHDPERWRWALSVGLILLPLCAVVGLIDPVPAERPRPDTPLEIGMVLRCEVIRWSGGSGTHTVRVVMCPLTGPDHLVHGYIETRRNWPVDVPTGWLLGFRRHPTTRHLVWMDGYRPPSADTVPVTAADSLAALRLLANGIPSVARVRGLTVGSEVDSGRHRVDVDLTMETGRPGRARCVLPSELLPVLTPGTELSVVYRDRLAMDPADCVILFPAASVLRGG